MIHDENTVIRPIDTVVKINDVLYRFSEDANGLVKLGFLRFVKTLVVNVPIVDVYDCMLILVDDSQEISQYHHFHIIDGIVDHHTLVEYER